MCFRKTEDFYGEKKQTDDEREIYIYDNISDMSGQWKSIF